MMKRLLCLLMSTVGKWSCIANLEVPEYAKEENFGNTMFVKFNAKWCNEMVKSNIYFENPRKTITTYFWPILIIFEYIFFFEIVKKKMFH